MWKTKAPGYCLVFVLHVFLLVLMWIYITFVLFQSALLETKVIVPVVLYSHDDSTPQHLSRVLGGSTIDTELERQDTRQSQIDDSQDGGESGDTAQDSESDNDAVSVLEAQGKVATASRANTVKRYFCDHCDYSADRRSRLEGHLMLHTQPQQFAEEQLVVAEQDHVVQCSHCDYQSQYSSKLQRHLRVHFSDETDAKHQCPSCPFKVRTIQRLQRHLCPRGDSLQCAHCPYKATRPYRLREHLMTHTGETPFPCPHCSYKCSRSSTLTRHMRVHQEELPYNCPVNTVFRGSPFFQYGCTK